MLERKRFLSGPNGRYTAHSDGRGKFILIGVTGDQILDLGTITLPAS